MPRRTASASRDTSRGNLVRFVWFVSALFALTPSHAYQIGPGGCSATTGHGVSYSISTNSYQLAHDGGSEVEAESRVVVTLSGGEYKGFLFKTSAGTLSAKSDHAQEPSACSGAMGHKSASPKTSTEVYLDLPSTPGTVTVTAEVVSAKTSVFEVTLDITVVEREARYYRILDGTPRDDTSQGCQDDYMTIPDDCVIAPNTPEVLELIAQHYWGTHGVCVDDGRCYWGLHGGGSVGNQDCSSSMNGFHTTTIGGETAYRPPCCSERILLKCEGGNEGDGGGNDGDGGGNEGNGRDGLVLDEEDSAGRSSVAIPLLFAVAAVLVGVPAV
jgi:hypothetical protein